MTAWVQQALTFAVELHAAILADLITGDSEARRPAS